MWSWEQGAETVAYTLTRVHAHVRALGDPGEWGTSHADVSALSCSYRARCQVVPVC